MEKVRNQRSTSIVTRHTHTQHQTKGGNSFLRTNKPWRVQLTSKNAKRGGKNTLNTSMAWVKSGERGKPILGGKEEKLIPENTYYII